MICVTSGVNICLGVLNISKLSNSLSCSGEQKKGQSNISLCNWYGYVFMINVMIYTMVHLTLKSTVCTEFQMK